MRAGKPQHAPQPEDLQPIFDEMADQDYVHLLPTAE